MTSSMSCTVVSGNRIAKRSPSESEIVCVCARERGMTFSGAPSLPYWRRRSTGIRSSLVKQNNQLKRAVGGWDRVVTYWKVSFLEFQ